jgi:aminopeptidase N
VGPTRVGVWYVPAATARAHALRMLSYAERSMRTFIRSFGGYPYPEVDVVLTGFASFGGMEYPTLVFSNSNRITIAHELAHQWWYGMVGNNQFSDPWFDEGLATWSESLPWDPWIGCRGVGWPSGTARLTNDMDYWRDHPFEYGPVVYSGGGCMMAQLAHGFGLERFLRILARLAERHRFGIVRVETFQRAIDRAAERHWPTFPADFWTDWRMDT